MDKLQKLYELASATKPQTTAHQALLQRNSKLNLHKARKERQYSNGNFETWFDNTQKYVDQGNRNEYWDLALEAYPGTPEQAQTFIRQHIASQSTGDPYNEEIGLRNLMTKMPDWAVQENQPRLAYLQAINSNQNLMKAVTLYKTNLKQRLDKLSLGALDLDVPEEEHLKDFLKLESINLLDVAKVENGRLVTANEKGVIMPAFAIDDRTQVLPKDPNGTPLTAEMDLIYQVAPSLIKDMVKVNLDNSRQLAQAGNRAASAAAMKMLESGDLPIDNWGEAFTITSQIEPEAVLKAGVGGLVKKNPYRNGQEILREISRITDAYPDLISETQLRRSNVSVSKPTT